MRKRFAKILATVGPASTAAEMLKLLHEVGVDAFRLNFSHGTHADHARTIKAIRKIEETTGESIAIVADLQGPKIRVGAFETGQIQLKYGETVQITAHEGKGKPGHIVMPHKDLILALQPGDVLKFDDGKLMVTITEKQEDKLLGRVDIGGVLRDKKGVNIIGTVLPVSAMTDKDRKDLAFALENGVDYIALSFVQKVKDVMEASEHIAGRAGLIVKIEKPSAVEDIEHILDLADAAMVARGDLGVELPLEQVPVVQRKIISVARRLGKPVIVATHMLESMIDAATPTRAEASDVATAIYQGADAVMLSAETAVGRHPATAVAIMDRIIKAAEHDPTYPDTTTSSHLRPETTVNDAISQSIHSIADVLGCKAVLGFTRTGSTVLRIARERPPCPILGLTTNKDVASRLALIWGVRPVVMDDPKGFADMLETTQAIAITQADCTSGDKIIIAAGIPFGRPGTTDTLKIATID